MSDYEETDLPKIEVNDMPFEWETEKGTFRYLGEDVVLFWIDTAMKSFLETIQEVSGEEAADVVLETTGFRMGTDVSNFYKQTDINEIFDILPKIYGSAGWGKVTIKEVSLENKTAVIQVEDSWEYKIIRKQGKKKPNLFLPGHWAGVLSGLFHENIWYNISKSQAMGDDYDEYTLGPSSVTPTVNMHDLARNEEQAHIIKLEEMVDERTKELTDLIQEISSPIIPVLDDIVVIPLLGRYDENRANELLDKTLERLPKFQAKYLILDLTGLDGDANEHSLSLIQGLTSTTSLLGTDTILVGISPDLSMKMTQGGFTLRDNNFHCFSTLKHAILFALSQEGRQIP
ncbi:STAS domain-containing protein [Salipaludibacillus sp. CF4.18]|uniref:STAS domain-containing protein n=1 Tax=Salipaludibacillus sp. CF4.18 TaxID=3373081 RepID=UPI003EE57979